MDFCALFLYPTTFPNSLIRPNSFLVASLRFSMYSIMPSANSNNLLLLSQLGFILLLFLLWLPWLGCPKLCFIIAPRVYILVLVLILEEMLSGCHHWEWCLLWVYHIWPLICWCRFPLCPLYGEFYHKWVLNFVKSFFCIYWDYHMDFIF